MNKLILAALALLLASCATQKRCFQKFPPQIITKDSVVVKDTTIYKDISVPVPGAQVLITDTLPCPGVTFEKSVQDGHLTASVSLKNNRLKVDCKADSFQLVIKDLKIKIATLERHHSEVQVVQSPPVVEFRLSTLGWYSIIANILFILWLLRKPILNRLS